LEVMGEGPEELRQAAVAHLKRTALPLRPRKQWPAGALPAYGWSGKIADGLRAEPGRALCVLKDGGWGRLVFQGKYREGRFGESLARALAEMVAHWQPEPF